MTDHAFPWLPWGEAAFARAREERRYVLLHIGATWCHWCHVMDEGSYTHPAVARLVRERFVAVRVDTDERPDVNERYNQGGWPTMAVLDADGEVLLGRTYVSGGELAGILGSFDPTRDRWAPLRSAPRRASPATVDAVRAAVDRAWDDRDAGFGDGDKFPHPAIGEWLLDRALRGEAEAGERLTRTLDALAGRGVIDGEEGGFYRYATRPDWTEPHYEKLLDDQARLVALLLRADAWRPTPRWRDAAAAALRWSIHTLWDDRVGAFGGSQDADEEYHRLPRAARGSPPAVDPTVYAGWNGRMIEALVRASAALDRPGLLGLARQAGASLRALIAPDGRVARFLRDGRPSDVGGLLEDQVGVAAGLLALAQATGGGWLGDATRVLAWTREELRASRDGSTPGWLDRPPGGPGRLADPTRPVLGNAAFADACARLAAVSGDASWREVAREAADASLAEAGPWGFLAAPAAAAAERLLTTPVLVKVYGRPDLRDAALRHPRPEVSAQWLDDAGAAALGVPAGAAMACTDRACARPSRDLPELERALTMLLPRAATRG